MKVMCGLVVLALLSLNATAGDTNFVAQVNVVWQSNNASNILTYVEDNMSTNENVEVLFARGVVAAYLQGWGRGATNYFGQAMSMAATSQTYSPDGQSNIVQWISSAKGLFGALAQDAEEPVDSEPSWDTNLHAIIFGELGDEIPYYDVLHRIATTE